jgi:hypothetical protein
MIAVRVVVLASLGAVLGSQLIAAQVPLAYRGYALESSVATVVKISGARDVDVRTLYERPAKIQEFVWRAPYLPSGSAPPDPVRYVRFRFCDDKLYEIVVTYDRERTEGLTRDDVIDSLSRTYGIPLLSSKGTSGATLPPNASGGGTGLAILAQWEDTGGLLTLTQDTYPPDYQLVLISKIWNERALTAINEAVRLDGAEAPQRELDRREKKVSDARIAAEKARLVNKAAFRP